MSLRKARGFRSLLFLGYTVILFSIGFLKSCRQPLYMRTFSLNSTSQNYSNIIVNNTTDMTSKPVYEWRCATDKLTKPLFVIGILSAIENMDRRTALRKTLFRAIKETDIPFDVVPMFIMDLPSESITHENNTYRDIMLTHVNHSGWAHSDSKKIHQWYRYVTYHFPNARLVGKMDDDVHLCTPSLFNRLYRFLHDDLVYTKKNGQLDLLGLNNGFDEMFVTLGMSLVERLAKREMCYGKCNETGLVETGHAGFSFGSWLEIYHNELLQVYDHHRFVHFYRYVPNKERFVKLVRPTFCLDNTLYHKALPWVIYELDRFRLKYQSSSRYNFTSEYVRSDPTFPNSKMRYNWTKKEQLTCDDWGIILESSFSSMKFQGGDLKHLCLVIIAENVSSSNDDYIKKILFTPLKRIVFMTVSDQKLFQVNLTSLIPPGHIGRKNIGYLYAMQNGAKYIWDFHENVNLQGMSLKQLKLRDKFTICGSLAAKSVINPYLYLVVNSVKVWPRGFPINQINNKNELFLCKQTNDANIAITQMVQMDHLDTDSLLSLTSEDVRHNGAKTRNDVKYLVMPQTVFSPVNHKFTVWSAAAFPYLVLPITVNDEVSDVWRGYIAQHFLSKSNFQTAYVPVPNKAVNERSNIKAAFQRRLNLDEFDIYAKSDTLLQTLRNLESNSKGNYDITKVYYELYRRDYLNDDDLELVHIWSLLLKSITDSQNSKKQ